VADARSHRRLRAAGERRGARGIGHFETGHGHCGPGDAFACPALRLRALAGVASR
jgi:hypothetical protein